MPNIVAKLKDPTDVPVPAEGYVTVFVRESDGKLVTKDSDDVTADVSGIALTDTDPTNVTKAAASEGVSDEAARADHKHDVSTATASSLSIGGSNAEGSASSLARSDHTHALPSFGTTGGSIAQGDDSRFPSATQKLALAGTSGTPGTGNEYVTDDDPRMSDTRDPTTHGDEHAGDGDDPIPVATTSVDGLLSAADKTFLDSIGDVAIVTDDAPANVTKAAAAVGISDEAARADHKHDISTATASSLTIGGSNAEGSASSLARSDHTHALPAYGSSAGTITQGNDARLADARTPTAHASSHQHGGSDQIATATAGNNLIPKANGSGKLDIAWLPTGSSSTTVVVGDDARLPTAGEKQALAGTSGTPGTGNEYVTDDDLRVGTLSGDIITLTKNILVVPSTGDAFATTGSMSAAAYKHNGKDMYLSGAFAEVAAAGSDLSGATPVSDQHTLVTSGTGGVKLLASGVADTDGSVVSIIGNKLGVTINVYPPDGAGTINGGSAGDPVTLTAGCILFVWSRGNKDFKAISTGSGGGGAPDDADYLVKTSNGGLSAERVVTDTATVAWDWATGSQAKAAVVDGSISLAKMADLAQDQFIVRTTGSTGVPQTATVTAIARTILDDVTTSDMRTTLGVAIGSNVQAYDADLAAIAGLTSAADKGIQFTGSGTAGTYDLTTAGKNLLDDADAAAQRTTLGLGYLATQNNHIGGFGNFGIVDSVSSGILTLSVKQGDGSSAPAAGAGSVYVTMRNSTATVGSVVVRSITSALTLDLLANQTLNFQASQNCYLWAYFVDSDGSGAMKLGVSQVRMDDSELTTCTPASGTVTITNATPAVVTWTGHNLSNGDQVMFSTTGALPAGITAATVYWITNVAANTFRLATSPSGATTGGAAINTSNAGSGVHTVKVIFAAGKLISDGVYTSKPIKFASRHRFNLNSSSTWIASLSIALADTVPTSETVHWAFETTNTSNHTNGTQTVINWGTATRHTHFSESGANSWVQVPSTGYYNFQLQLCNNLASWAADSYFAAGLFVNIANSGTQTTTLCEWVSQDAPGTSTYSNAGGSKTLFLTAGDFVNIGYINGAGATLVLDGFAIDCWLTVTKVGSPS